MKNSFLLFFALCTYSVSAQISISKFSMPSKGETMKTYTTLDASVDLGTTDGPQTWDFTSLGQDVYNEVTLLDPSEGTETVANADFLIKTGDFIEQYYTKTEASIEEVFLKSLDPLLNTFEITNYYTDPITYRKGTIVLFNSYTDNSKFSAAIAWDELPDTITAGIGLPLDSIRINTNFERNDYIDAYGTVMLPEGDWEALRESTTTIRTVSIDVFFLGNWIEAPAAVLETFLGDFGDLLAPDTTYSMNFYTDAAIEVLAAFRLNDDLEPTSCEYKAGSEITNIELSAFTNTPSITVFPNPSYGHVTFTIENTEPGNHTIKIYDVLGQSRWTNKVYADQNNKHFNFDLSNALSKGTYLYVIYDDKGNKMETKRLIIVKP